ncbi:MAG: ABC transporter permease [bacterium]|nr:ABC transporter permease [Candidatus Kapabacteria bacterium]
MPFEWFIARRYLRPKRNLISFISIISILGITVGVFALICVMSVFNGFNSLVKDLLVGFDPHIRVTPAATATLDSDSLLPRIQSISGITAAAPFVSGRSVVLFPELRVIQLRAMRRADVGTAIGLEQKIVSGRFEDASPANPHPIVLGSLLSFALRASVGDTLSLLSQGGLEETLTMLAEPKVIQCTVTGIFEMGNKEYDSYYAYTNLETGREIFDVTRSSMGIEIRLDNLERAGAVKDTLMKVLGPDYRVETWYDLHRDLFAVMELERWSAYIILSLITVVAVFNVLGSLTMTVIKKRRDIGMLKIMGASDGAIQRIYLFEGMMVGIIGLIGGLALGLYAVYLQREYGLFMKLDVSVYIISALPVELRPMDILLVSSTALLLAFTAALYPARRAARLLAADAIRWE